MNDESSINLASDEDHLLLICRGLRQIADNLESAINRRPEFISQHLNGAGQDLAHELRRVCYWEGIFAERRPRG